MGKLLKGWTLENGLVLEVHDESAQYYADFWNLKIVIRGTVKVQSEYLRTICPLNPSEQKAKRGAGRGGGLSPGAHTDRSAGS